MKKEELMELIKCMHCSLSTKGPIKSCDECQYQRMEKIEEPVPFPDFEIDGEQF